MSATIQLPADPMEGWTVAELQELAAADPALRELLAKAWHYGWQSGYKNGIYREVPAETPFSVKALKS